MFLYLNQANWGPKPIIFAIRNHQYVQSKNQNKAIVIGHSNWV